MVDVEWADGGNVDCVDPRRRASTRRMEEKSRNCKGKRGKEKDEVASSCKVETTRIDTY